MNKTSYVCWEPAAEDDPGATPPARNVVEAFDAEDAAAEYAEREWFNSDPYDAATFRVRDSNGVVHMVDVFVEYAPMFSGRMRA